MEVLHLLLGINPSAPVAPDAIVPLGIAGYALPLGTNVMITILIVSRIWYVSRGAKELVVSMKGFRSASDTARRAMNIIIESGVLYLVTQLIFVVLFALQHPAQAIMAVVAVQIYVRDLTSELFNQKVSNKIFWFLGNCSNNDHHSCWSRYLFRTNIPRPR